MLRIIRDSIVVAFFIIAIYYFAKSKSYYSRYWPETVAIQNIRLTDPDSVIIQKDTALIPVCYLNILDFREIDPEKRKDIFIQFLLPAIVITRQHLLDDLHHIQFIENRIKEKREIKNIDSVFLNSMKAKYETDSLPELEKRLYPHPVSLTLCQAILETGWGTSGIFLKGNNIFGIMSFSNTDSRYKVKFPDPSLKRYIRTYQTLIASIEDYHLIFSKVSSYKKFRQKRWEGASSFELLRYINSYHESDKYLGMARSIIEDNQLEKFDNVMISSRYLSIVDFESFLMNF